MTGYGFIFESENNNKNEEWSDQEWPRLHDVNSVPVKGDLIDFRGILNDESVTDMLGDFETINFNVIKRSLSYIEHESENGEKIIWQFYNLHLQPVT